MTTCRLPDRTIVHVGDLDAEELLNRLVTRNLLGMAENEARFAALLSPQGKLSFDFLVYRRGDGFWLDVARDLSTELSKRLGMYRLRARVTIAPRADLAVDAIWGEPQPKDAAALFVDPRSPELGWRRVVSAETGLEPMAAPSLYRSHCIQLGVPAGGVDYSYGDGFVHDANLDLLHGVDFDKGCYVGQEVVSRVHHRATARKRIARVHFHGAPAAPGSALTAGALTIGRVTSVAETTGLAAIRIDRLEEAVRANLPIMAGDTLVELVLPSAEPHGA